jgi:hypothetical protein
MLIKSPDQGQVKSRLAASLPDGLVVHLYKSFVRDLISTLERGDHEFTICFYPPDAATSILEWLGTKRNYIAQRGHDLGARMANAFKDLFGKGFRNVIVIGSDSPDLPGHVFAEAFDYLKSCDAVIGPSMDGGYYLLGFKKETFLPHALEGIDWSTERVFRQTMEAFRKNAYTVHVLGKWADIDTIADLRAFFFRHAGNDSQCPQTMACLRGCREVFT